LRVLVIVALAVAAAVLVALESYAELLLGGRVEPSDARALGSRRRRSKSESLPKGPSKGLAVAAAEAGEVAVRAVVGNDGDGALGTVVPLPAPEDSGADEELAMKGGTVAGLVVVVVVEVVGVVVVVVALLAVTIWSSKVDCGRDITCKPTALPSLTIVAYVTDAFLRQLS
jgi:hypothetical protein